MKKLFPLLLLCFITLPVFSQVISVMSFNVRYDNKQDGINQWKNRIDLMQIVLGRNACDIYCFQEVLDNQLQELKIMLPGYDYVGVGRKDGKTRGEYVPVFYNAERFELLHDPKYIWISKKPDVPGSKSWRSACPRMMSIVQLQEKKSGKKICVINTHFDHVSAKARSRGARMILSILEKINTDAILVCGDLNARPASLPVRILEKELNRLHTTSGPDHTVQAFGKSVNSGNIIDYIFSRGNITSLEGKVVELIDGKRYVSDHWPVVGKFEVY